MKICDYENSDAGIKEYFSIDSYPTKVTFLLTSSSTESNLYLSKTWARKATQIKDISFFGNFLLSSFQCKKYNQQFSNEMVCQKMNESFRWTPWSRKLTNFWKRIKSFNERSFELYLYFFRSHHRSIWVLTKRTNGRNSIPM